MRHSKRAPSSPVTYHSSPRFLACSPVAYHLSPRSGASGYQNRVHKNHEYLNICPLCPQLHAFLSDRLITWGSTARPLPPPLLFTFHLSPALAQRRHLFPAISRRLSPPLLFTFHLSPALAQRGTLPKSSARTLANWQTATGAIKTPLLSAKAAPAWQSGKLPIQPKYGAYYQTPSPPRPKAPFAQTPCPLAPLPPRSLDPSILGAGDPVALASPSGSDTLPSCPLAPSIPRSLDPSNPDPSRPARAPRPGSARRSRSLDPLIPRSLDPFIPLPLTAPARRDKVLNSRVTAAGSGAVELRCGLNLKTRARDVPGL